MGAPSTVLTQANNEIYTNFDEMSEDIVDHTRLTGDHIVAHKDQRNMILGFATDGNDKAWTFRLCDLKARNVKSKDPVLFFEFIKDDRGRELLAHAFSHSTNHDIIEHIKQCYECRAYHAVLEVMSE